MILIAHRGLYDGPDKAKENHPDQIKDALKNGYHVEIDIRRINKKLFLGHDEPQYEIKDKFIDPRKTWIHCKNLEALYYFSTHIGEQYNYFWHENDEHTLTSKKYIWSNFGKPLTEVSIMVMPEFIDSTLQNTINVQCYGICSDYVKQIQELRSEADQLWR